jgi:two-component system OmpR family response regulator
MPARPTSERLIKRDVVVVQWPDDAAAVLRLAASHLPRLLLVQPEADPPDGGDCVEDWIRLPADERDIAARLNALSRRASQHHALPEVDEHGRLHHRGRWVSTSPIEQRLVAAMVERFSAVISAEELIDRAWPDARPAPNVLRVHMTRLKKRIRPLGLDIRGLRPSGYVLEERGLKEAG